MSAPNDAPSAEERLTDLEIRYAHQSRLVAALDDVVREFASRVEKLERQMIALRESHAEAALWDAGSHLSKGALPNIHRMWVDHVKANRSPGLAAKAVRAGVNERALRMGIAKDYRSNLY